MAGVLGKDVLVYVGGSPIACGKTCKLSLKTQVIETTSIDSGAFVGRIAGILDWLVTMDALTIYGSNQNFYLLYSAWKARQPVQLKFVAQDAAVMISFEGSAIIDSLDQTGTVNDVSTFTASFSGNGKLVDTWIKLGGSFSNSFSGSFSGG